MSTGATARFSTYLLAGISGGSASTVNEASIAAKVDAALADDFKRLADSNAALAAAIAATPDRVADEAAERLKA